MTAPMQAVQSLPELPEPSAWVSLNVLTQKASVGKLPITSLQPGVYQNEKVFSEDQMRTYALSAISSNEAEVGRLMGDLRASEVAELGAQSANRHLSALVDFERQVSERCMVVMKALMDAAEPVNNEFQDCHIDYADYAKFVDAHAELLYVIKNGERPAALTQGETK